MAVSYANLLKSFRAPPELICSWVYSVIAAETHHIATNTRNRLRIVIFKKDIAAEYSFLKHKYALVE